MKQLIEHHYDPAGFKVTVEAKIYTLVGDRLICYQSIKGHSEQWIII